MRAPAVSVLVPAYNGARFLQATIESVLAQELRDFELVVCDNASTDETPAVCARYDDPRFRHARFEEHVGQAANWNRCVAAARAPYVILLHADDLLAPAFLARATAALDANADVALVHSAIAFIDADGAAEGQSQLFPQDLVASGEVLLRRLLLEGCVVSPAGALLRRSALDVVGPFTERVLWGVDWHMWLRVADRFDTAYLAAPLASYRRHDSSGTSKVFKEARNAEDECWALKDFLEHARRPIAHELAHAAYRQVAHRTWCIAEALCRAGACATARLNLTRSAEIDPGLRHTARFWGLWAATYVGYPWFARAVALRRRVVGGRGA